MKNCLIIINCNDFKSTKHLVDNVVDYNIIDKILIVDNNSKNEEKELLKTITNDKIEKLFNDENLGYSGGINLGAQYLIDKYKECNLIISNSDIVIMDENDLVKLIELLNYEKVGLVAPSLLERGKVNRGWKDVGAKTDFFLSIPLIRDFIEDNIIYYENDYYSNDYSFVDVISSAFFLINSEMFKKIGYMDENVFLYYEGAILCNKIKNNDLMVVIHNKVKVKHLYSKSVDKLIGTADKYKLFKTSQLYYHSTYKKTSKFGLFLLKLQYRIGYAFRYVFKRK